MNQSQQHRATPEQWEVIGICKEEGKIPWPTATCLLELRARIEALEAAQLEQAESHRFCTDAIVRRVEALEAPMTELRAASAEARPAGGLVERVAKGINWVSPWKHKDEARAAIREVAAWLRSEYPRRSGLGIAWANLIEQEADRG
jgi:hypothetical protein